ncbi:hypothetical protein AAMO2058_000264400 [Amorphochlora amoebiformis]
MVAIVLILTAYLQVSQAASPMDGLCGLFGIACGVETGIPGQHSENRAKVMPVDIPEYSANVVIALPVQELNTTIVATGQVHQYVNASQAQITVHALGQDIVVTTYEDHQSGKKFTVTKSQTPKGGINCTITPASPPSKTLSIVSVGETFVGNELSSGWLAINTDSIVALFQSAYTAEDTAFVMNPGTPNQTVFLFTEFEAIGDPRYAGIPAVILPRCKPASNPRKTSIVSPSYFATILADVTHSALRARGSVFKGDI